MKPVLALILVLRYLQQLFFIWARKPCRPSTDELITWRNRAEGCHKVGLIVTSHNFLAWSLGAEKWVDASFFEVRDLRHALSSHLLHQNCLAFLHECGQIFSVSQQTMNNFAAPHGVFPSCSAGDSLAKCPTHTSVQIFHTSKPKSGGRFVVKHGEWFTQRGHRSRARIAEKHHAAMRGLMDRQCSAGSCLLKSDLLAAFWSVVGNSAQVGALKRTRKLLEV